MRAAIFAVFLGLAATPASAAPPAMSDTPFHLRLPSEDRMAAVYAHQAAQSDSIATTHAAMTASPSAGMTFGFIHAESVSDTRPGRHRSVMQYDLDGVHVFGGAVGGNLSGHGAMLTLHWPSGGQ